MEQRSPYSGNKRRLVIAFDLGTTFSGVSFAVLDPNKPPKVETVGRYPGQDTYDTKIPTVIHYDRSGKVLAVGEELPPELGDEDDDDALPIRVEWFKLLLQPRTAPSAMRKTELPPSKTIVDVFADFYRYLNTCAEKYIKESVNMTAMGNLVWDSVKNDIDFVLSHPNGWEGPQQELMRKAAVQAGLLKEKDARSTRLSFVTEGEASMHFCVSNGHSLEAGDNIMIIDAGGGTVDLSTYSFESSKPIKAVEMAAPACLVEGSVIVRHRAHTHVQAKLRNSTFGTEGCVDAIANEFDKTAKKRFKGSGNAAIKFSHNLRDTDASVGIRNGRITLSESEMRSFFDPGIDALTEAIKAQREAGSSRGEINTYFLVGGYAASEYLHDRLKTFLDEDGLKLYRPGSSPNKAVAEGAVSFYLDRFVSARVARFTYGTVVSVPAYPFMLMPPTQKVRDRVMTMYRSMDGELWLPNAFREILTQGTAVSETQEFRKEISMFRLAGGQNGWKTDVDIVAYRGTSPPMFVDEEQARFTTLCQVEANLKKAPRTQEQGPAGTYFLIEAIVVLSFGLTEFKAELAWTDKNGVEKRSPATIVYDPDFSVNVADE
ncbi:unnamed protein product [Peniophora sp. CBMAI 1063]|nr:unnamed protein product [Peniophora sp. CBMAI 1063]